MHKSDCRVQQVFSVIRHGTRFPSAGDVKDMEKLIPLKKIVGNYGRLKSEDLEAILNWKNDANDDTNKNLSEQGKRDMEFLSSRMIEAFGEIFQEQYNPQIHKVN